MALVVDSVLGSTVEVSGEEAVFLLKRPIDDRGLRTMGEARGENRPRLTTVVKIE
jgi:hypothetical protein